MSFELKDDDLIFGKTYKERKSKTLREVAEELIKSLKKPKIPVPPEEAFILKYDKLGKELIRKANERFHGTRAEIPAESLTDNQELENMYILKRLALITAIYNDPNLRNLGILPITLLESELLLKAGKLPKNPGEYWEDLALILYDISNEGKNPKEAVALKESIRNHKASLGLSEEDLEKRLLVVNSGLEKNDSFPRGVKPVVLSGITQVYVHPILERTGSNYNFEYGLENGLPSVNALGAGKRTLYMPSANENIGLRVLYRGRGLSLGAWNELLVNSSSDGRVTLARKGAKKFD
jgi:hypothetical protein